MKYGFYKPEKKNKLHAIKTIVDGITFASKKEAKYYQQLKMMLQSGDVIKFSLQPVFKFVFFHKPTGFKKVIKYIGDFRVWFKSDKDKKRKWTIIDTKGFRTEVYKQKNKLMKKILNIEIIEI